MASQDKALDASAAKLPSYQSVEYQRDVMDDEIMKIVKLLRFAVVQRQLSSMPREYFMELDAMEFYASSVQLCIDILREERRRLLDAQLKLTKLIAKSSQPASSSCHSPQSSTPSSSTHVLKHPQDVPQMHTEKEIKDALEALNVGVSELRGALTDVSMLKVDDPVNLQSFGEVIRYTYHPDRDTCLRNLWEEHTRLMKRRDALELEFEKQRTAALNRH